MATIGLGQKTSVGASNEGERQGGTSPVGSWGGGVSVKIVSPATFIQTPFEGVPIKLHKEPSEEPKTENSIETKNGLPWVLRG